MEALQYYYKITANQEFLVSYKSWYANCTQEHTQHEKTNKLTLYSWLAVQF